MTTCPMTMSSSRRPLQSDTGGVRLSPQGRLQAPPTWAVLDFISDLHLQAGEGATFEAWCRYMRTARADAMFILGDLFEVWIGDDVGEDFEARCVEVLRNTAQRMPVFFMHGNRDFLAGPKLMAACGASLLQDPTVLAFGGQNWLLSHGDAMCLADAPYQKFRAEVRSPAWQNEFLAKPLAKRRGMAVALRRQSEAHKKTVPSFVDLDADAVCGALHDADATTLIHGHTHQPGDHGMGQGLRRIVLSDWDLSATPPRAQVLRLSLAQGGPGASPATQTQRLSPERA